MSVDMLASWVMVNLALWLAELIPRVPIMMEPKTSKEAVGIRTNYWFDANRGREIEYSVSLYITVWNIRDNSESPRTCHYVKSMQNV